MTVPHILAILPDYMPSNQIGIVTPLMYAAQTGAITFDVRLEHSVTPDEVASAAVIVTGRNSDPTFAPIYALAAARGIPLISEIDDYLFDLPSQYPEGDLYRHGVNRAYMEDLLRQSALLRVYSTRLAELLHPFNPQIEHVIGAVDWALTPAALPTLDPAAPLRLVYATSRYTYDVLFGQLAPDLHRLLADFGSRIELHFLGYRPPEFQQYAQVKQVAFQADYAAYFRAFTRAGYAIGFAPMLPGDFYMSKSNNKFREYATAGTVGIYLDCPVYAGSGGVIDGVTGRLVDGRAGSWYAAASALIADREERERIRRAAYDFARRTYTLETVSATWLAQIGMVLAAAPSRPADDLESLPDRWWFTRGDDARYGVRRVLRDAYRRAFPLPLRLRFRRWRHTLLKALLARR